MQYENAGCFIYIISTALIVLNIHRKYIPSSSSLTLINNNDNSKKRYQHSFVVVVVVIRDMSVRRIMIIRQYLIVHGCENEHTGHNLQKKNIS